MSRHCPAERRRTHLRSDIQRTETVVTASRYAINLDFVRKKRKKANTSRHDETKTYNTMADTVHTVPVPHKSTNQFPPTKKVHSPQFSANVLCGQTAGWIKMPLGMEVGLGPDDFVLNADPVCSRKKAQPPPNFWPMSILDFGHCHPSQLLLSSFVTATVTSVVYVCQHEESSINSAEIAQY